MNAGPDPYDKARRFIPGWAGTLSKVAVLPPEEPTMAERAEGCRMWDVNGKAYIDYRCALGPVVLGHGHPAVKEAILRQLESGIVFSYPHRSEGELAELLVESLPCAEKVRFMKTGSEAMAVAIKLARAFTGRDIIISSGYHGWMQLVSNTRGVPEAVAKNHLSFAYGDIATLRQLLERHGRQVAAVTVSGAYPHLDRKDTFLTELRNLTNTYEILLVIDEIVTGFRLRLGGLHAFHGVSPDLAVFAKGLANGMPLSAITGRADIMDLAGKEAVVSSTFSGEALSLAAAIATVNVFQSEPVVEHLWRVGGLLQDGLNAIFRDAGIPLELRGLPPCPMFCPTTEDPARGTRIQSAFFRGMFARGVALYHVPYVSYAHQDDDIALTFEAARDACHHLDVDAEINVNLARPALGAAAMR